MVYLFHPIRMITWKANTDNSFCVFFHGQLNSAIDILTAAKRGSGLQNQYIIWIIIFVFIKPFDGMNYRHDSWRFIFCKVIWAQEWYLCAITVSNIGYFGGISRNDKTVQPS